MLKITVNESSATRILSHLKNYDCGTITAFREKVKDVTDGTLDRVLDFQGQPVPMPDKKAWNRELRASLLKLGYGVTNIKGRYKEEGWDMASDEESFFVVNLTNDPKFIENMAKLGEGYNQDSILIKEKGKDTAYLLGTNGADWPGYGETFDIGKLVANVPLDYLGASSVIKNKAFAFKSESHEPQMVLDTFLDYGNNAKSGIAGSATPVLEELGIASKLGLAEYRKAATEALNI